MKMLKADYDSNDDGKGAQEGSGILQEKQLNRHDRMIDNVVLDDKLLSLNDVKVCGENVEPFKKKISRFWENRKCEKETQNNSVG